MRQPVVVAEAILTPEHRRAVGHIEAWARAAHAVATAYLVHLATGQAEGDTLRLTLTFERPVRRGTPARRR